MMVKEETLTVICRTTNPANVVLDIDQIDMAGVACPDIIKATLAILGKRARDVVRIQAGSVCSSPCTDRVIVGFKDGHLEAAAADWGEVDGAYEPAQGIGISPLHKVATSVWPWRNAATFTSPPIARETLPIPAPATLSRLPNLPSCGTDVETEVIGDSAAGRCFTESVLAGRPAQYMLRTDGDGGAIGLRLFRFEGSGPVVEYVGRNRTETGEAKVNWSTPEPSVLEIGLNNNLRILPIAPYGFQ